MLNIDYYKKQCKVYYKLLKDKKVDNYLLIVGTVGVAIGLLFSVSIINEIFAWFILFGVCMKLYDSAEEAKRNIVPYDFSNMLPPPTKKNDE